MTENFIWAHTEEPEDDGLRTILELRSKVIRDKAKFLGNLKYWNHKTEDWVLQHKYPLYDVCLKDLSSRLEYLDLILHMHSKQWMSKQAFVEFVTATRYLLAEKLHI